MTRLSATAELFSIADQFAESPTVTDLIGQRLALRAELEGVSVEDLGDRVIPDFGLNQKSECEFDYGPRKFFARVSPDFSVSLFDDAGKPKKTLPKPGKGDDESIASLAGPKLKGMKLAIKDQASLQTKRLESAMIMNRRWKKDVWLATWNKHPFARLFTRQILWAANDQADKQTLFRVAEDFSFADANDDAFELPDAAALMIPHPLHLSASDLATWRGVFADYEIKQAFEQLDRDVYRPENANDLSVNQFANSMVDGRQLFYGLSRQTWKSVNFHANEAGQQSPERSAQFRMAGSREAAYFKVREFPSLNIAAVLTHTYSDYFPGNPAPMEVTLGELFFVPFEKSAEKLDVALERTIFQRKSLADVPDIVYSEAVRDVAKLARKRSESD